MSKINFDFSGINSIYVTAIKEDRRTIVFEVRNGRGIFVFMIFFSADDESKDQLFFFLARTGRMLQIKMYGRHEPHESHLNKFSIYLTDQHQQYILDELGILDGRGVGFDFNNFLKDINANIPQKLSFSELQTNCKTHKDAFLKPQLSSVIDRADRIYLIGPRQLPAGKKPQEKTLRKLYLHIEADPNVLERFIVELKRLNKTVAWSNNPERAMGNIRQMLDAM